MSRGWSPTRDANANAGMTSHRMAFASPGPDRYYSLSVSDLSDDSPPASDEKWLDFLRNGFPARAGASTSAATKWN